ncbi:MAG: Lrp/AsnC ligand binding domain-containing protein [Anaerolineales bacterium]
MAAFVLVKMTASGGWEEIDTLHKALHTIAGVQTVHFVAGPTDAIVFAEGADQAALAATVGNIRRTHGVGSTDTRIVWPT